MIIYELGSRDGIEKVLTILQDRYEGAVINLTDEMFAALGRESGEDEKALWKDEVPILPSGHFGGTCLLLPGDLGVFLYEDKMTGTASSFLREVCWKLIEEGHYAEIDGNDLMLKTDDGPKKVASVASTWLGDGLASVMHVSINTDEELIRKYCSKPMIKRPGEIGSLGYTAEDFVPLLYSVLGMTED